NPSSLSLTGLLKLNLVFGCGSLHLLLSVTGERLYDDNWGINRSDHWIKPVHFRMKGSLLLVQRTVTRTIVLQETIGKDALAYGMAEWSQAANPREIREKNSQVTAGAVSHCQEKHDVREQDMDL
ncbi:hypothetical protein STEG23_034410, partial [Scotinomys teguina]